jgi:rhodanese-related sulfurtransferase
MSHFVVMSLFFKLFGVQTQESATIKVLASTEFKTQISNQKGQLVDVRTAKEYNSGHIKNAINIDFNSSAFNVEFGKLDKKKALYVY